jgi:hypothetical protein
MRMTYLQLSSTTKLSTIGGYALKSVSRLPKVWQYTQLQVS